jgi:O-antigen/teichoic acid export membrane protein
VNASERIAVNTAATYARSIFAVGLALFSSRWILNGLGETDFGLFSVVGALIIFLGFINSVMASSSSRHFSYAIGQGDTDSVNRWFNSSFIIHLGLTIGLISLGWPIGEYVVRNVLTIPPERVDACIQVFRVSLISAFVNMVSIPYVAMFTAKQHIAELAFWGVLQAILIFVLAWLLIWSTFDRLLFYACGMVLIHVTIHAVQCARAIWLFEECRLRLSHGFDSGRLKELFSFASWTMIGRTGGTLRNQGSSILLNVYFGPVINAAYGIANQVSVQTATLSAAMMGAMSPEITAREGRGQRDSMIDLSVRACKFGALLVLLFAIPFIMEADYVLKLWLINPPPHAAALSQLILIAFLVDKAAAGYMYAVNAHGKIAAYQATVGTLLVMTLPLAWLFIKMGSPPEAVGVAFIIIQSLCSFGRVLWVRYLFGIPVRHWFAKVILPCGLTLVFATAMASVPRFYLTAGLTRLFLVCATSSATMVLASWMFAFSAVERQFVSTSIQKSIRRFASMVAR